VIEAFDGAGWEVDPLDPAAAVIIGLQDRAPLRPFDMPPEPAIVADVALSVRADRRTVWPASRPSDDRLGPVR